MKTIIRRLFLVGLILVMAFSCEKYAPETIDVEIKLVSDNDIEIDTFEEGDTVFFKFYLTNNLGRKVNYVRPTQEILNFLRVHKQDIEGDYENIGQPSVFWADVSTIDSINDNETKLIGNVPIISDFNWPEMNSGNYYVGDSLRLTIDDELHSFNSRIYFTIQ